MKNIKLISLVLVGILFISACSCSKTKEYTITFDSNGGSSVRSQIVKENELVKEPTNPTYEGYTFEGWYIGDTKYDFSAKVTKDITLVAKWEKVDAIEKEVIKKVKTNTKIFNSTNKSEEKNSLEEVNTYTVFFNSNGGSKVSSVNVKENEKVGKPSNPTKDKYKFLGWYLDGTEFSFNTKISSNITLIAKWEYIPTISYLMEDVKDNIVGQVVLYVTKDGEKVDGYLDITVINGKTITKEISKEGYNTNKKQIENISNARVK